jgi:hypothetical protein
MNVGVFSQLVTIGSLLRRQPERAMLLKQSQMVLAAFGFLGSDSFYRQRFLFITHSGIEVPGFSIRRRKCVDHVLVIPTHNPACGRCVLDCLLAITK